MSEWPACVYRLGVADPKGRRCRVPSRLGRLARQRPRLLAGRVLLVADHVGALRGDELEKVRRQLRIALEGGEAHHALLSERVVEFERREALEVEPEADLDK